MDIVFLGPPGAGKGTQAERLAGELGLPQLSTGAVLRKAVADGTPVGRRAKAIMDAGQLVPDEVVADLIREALARPDAAGGVIFDGYPRNAGQAETLDVLLGGIGRRVDLAILVDLPEDVIVERLSGRRSCPKDGATYHLSADPPAVEGRCDRCGGALVQRDDDRPGTVRDRLRVYREQTSGIESRYEAAGVLVRVDGTLGGPDDVFVGVRAAAEAAARARAGTGAPPAKGRPAVAAAKRPAAKRKAAKSPARSARPAGKNGRKAALRAAAKAMEASAGARKASAGARKAARKAKRAAKEARRAAKRALRAARPAGRKPAGKARRGKGGR